MAASYEDMSDSDDDEEECRVCRGPAEEGRPLFKPCKCSGSIGLTHQDCLTSWLEVTRGGGKCELCSTQFQFAPQYAEGTPDRLSPQEVCFRILRRLGAKWLPRALRALFAAFLWLIILPLSTSYIYHGWMYRPSAIVSRWSSWELAKRDTVGGAVIAIIIVVSFLSLMSFAEFLRFQWGGANADNQQQQRQRGGNNNNVGDRRNRGNNREGGARGAIEGEIDDIIIYHDDSDDELATPLMKNLLAKDEGSDDNDSDMSSLNARGGLFNDHIDQKHHAPTNEIGINEVRIPLDVQDDGVDRLDDNNHNGDNDADADADDGQNDTGNNEIGINEVEFHMGGNQEDGDAGLDDSNNDLIHPADNEEDQLEAFMRAQEEDQEQQQQQELDELPELEAAPPPPPPRQPAGNPRNPRPPRDDARFEPQFEPLQPAFADLDAQDDGADVEINIALDELLGFRGPLLALIRNLLWLLVFNTAYLGVFAFAPSKFGGSMYIIMKKVISLLPIQNQMPKAVPGWVGQIWDGIISSLQELDERSREVNLIYQPSQIAKMGIGYLSFSILIFLFKTIVGLVVRWKSRGSAAPTTPRGAQDNERIRDNLRRDAFRDNRLDDLRELEREDADRNREQNEAIGKRLLNFLECAVAISKVVILLFIKMLFLPLMLGVWLDLATLSLFDQTWNDRVEYAGTDLFGAIFLHWVTGITFMLLVTVSVLQLREVAHPDILARVIRPQEPQPDLLGNLLQESGATHTKRVLLSLAIYAALLAIHIWLPAHLLLTYDLGKYLPLFQPKFWHILMPQIQVPAELFIFHLCMLGVLEKYKNGIGEMQHHWLLFMGRYLGMTDQILPLNVDKFSLLGTLPVFVEDASPSQLEKLEEVPPFDGRNDDIYPLWNNMLSETDQTKREEWIRSNISRMDVPESPRYTNGISRRDGKKVLSEHAYMRLPSASSTSRLVVKTSDDASSNLLPTSIGPYRLKQGVTSKNRGEKSTHIEVWKEAVGKPIPRPPEGWDDLGVGGAERHGRWAWGDEHTSEIENSVAVRTPFFSDPAATKLAKGRTLAWLSAKMMILLFISWVAISVVVCFVLNAPLYTGHFALYLLRVPEDCMHDPLAFAIGILLMVPIIAIIAKLVGASQHDLRGGVVTFVRNLAQSLKHRRPQEKVKTLSAFFLLWLVICPILLGSIYCSLLVGIDVSTRDMILVNWGTGTLLLNLWATMCYFQMFTKRFWADLIIGEGRANANADEQDNEPDGARQGGDGGRNNLDRNNVAGGEDNAQVPVATEPPKFIWQGKDGAIARAVESIKAFTSGWEWDKVDKQLLLEDCAVPISKHLAIAFAIPVAALPFAASLTKAAGRQIGATAIFRIVAIATIIVDSINSSKQGLNRWFQAAHKIARDDRYLIGEILLNYSPGQASSSAED